MAQASEVQEKVSGKVHEIAKGFLVMGDEMLAKRMQDEEYNRKYEFNREERQAARQDVPLAIKTHTEEELRLQRETLERLERLKRLAEEDEELARQLQENETATLKRRSKRSQAKPADMVTVSATMDFGDSGASTDREMSRLFQEKEELERQKEKIHQEIKDQELAMELHNREMRKYMSRMSSGGGSHEQQSRAERRSSQNNRINDGKLGGKVISLSGFGGFEVADGIPDEERRLLINMQDEELARALQMSEEMKVAKRQTNYGAMEKRDAELARIIQQTENMYMQDPHRHEATTTGRTSMSHKINGDYLMPACMGNYHRSSSCCSNPAHDLPDGVESSETQSPTYCSLDEALENQYVNVSRHGVVKKRDQTKTQSFFQRPGKK